MSTPGNKPRDIKNLKARLGRTITPGQVGAPSFPPGASVPPPAMGGGFATPPVGSVPPPSITGSSPGSIPAPGGFPGGIAAPPFARPAPQQQRAQSLPSPAAAPAARVDPFGGAAPAQQFQTKKVTLVIDDSAIKDDELGRKSSKTASIVLVLGAAVGLVLGFMAGSTAGDRKQYEMAVQDGKEIYTKVQQVTKEVDQAKALIKQAVDASTGGPGKKNTVDFSAIEQLVALKRPFSANEFSGRLYKAFDPAVVNDLFDYYNGVNMLWDGFSTLGAKTAGQAKRESLTKSAAATDGLLNTEYGMVLSKNGDNFAGSIVFLTVAQAAEQEKPKKGEKPEPPKVKVSSSQGGQEVERELYTGQDGLSEDFEKYVFVVDKVRSRTILGESANLFGKYRADLMELNARMDKTTETQGRLITGLGKIASLSQ